MKEKKVIILVSFIVVILITNFTIRTFFTKNCEHKYEISDLEAMHVANLKAQTALANGNVDKKASYYFDSDSFLLVTTNQKPAAYGYGTKVKGDTVKEYNDEHNTQYTYDESVDYTDKIIQVIIDPEASEGNQILIEWVR